MESITDIRRINTINNFFKDHFDGKIVKLSLDGEFTCPNRDGTKGYGGCVFCSNQGSGEMASTVTNSEKLENSIEEQISLLSSKWPNAKGYIAYFQSYTSTYAPIKKLEKLFHKVLQCENIVGIAIATRPDCIDVDVLRLIKDLSSKTFVWVELGLQTYNDKTAEEMNRCYKTSQYEECVSLLLENDIRVITHIILGLPKESVHDMRLTINEICKEYNGKHIFGIKLHMLNVVKNSGLSKLNPNYISFESIDKYTDLVVELLRYIPWDITIHRLTGDVPRNILISPSWSYKKRSILNEIAKKMRSEDYIQGDLA